MVCLVCFSFVVEIQQRESSEVKAVGEVPHGFTFIPSAIVLLFNSCLFVSLSVVTDNLLTSVVALPPD